MLAPVGASAQISQSFPNFYFSGFFDRLSLGEEETAGDIEPLAVTGALGYWVLEGVGLELEAGFGVTDDSIRNLDADLRSEFALNLRLESPPTRGLAAYVLAGYVRTSYELSVDDFSSTINLPGGRIAAGLTYLVNPFIHIDAGVAHHNYADDTRVNSFRIGLRYNLKPQE